jgi:hypothetical protein
VQDFDCEQMRVSGCNDHYKFVLGAGAKAKSVTNNLPLLPVLAIAFSVTSFDNHAKSSARYLEILRHHALKYVHLPQKQTYNRTRCIQVL